MEQYIGQIMMFAGNFAPRSWAFCNGQLLAISQNQALFSILGTTYGGDGRTTFGLPDLRGRVPVHPGQAPGTSDNIRLGQKGGNDRHTLSVQELAPHSHDGSPLKGTLAVNEEDGASEDPQGKNFGVASAGMPYNSDANDKVMAANTVNVAGTTANTGSGVPFNIRNPYEGVNYIIALQGIFPPRS
jgi:microcystin-dependent protein